MLSDRELLTAVQDAADDFTVYGELGRHGESLAALLARERVGRNLVILMVSAVTNSAREIELSIEVKHELDARIPDGGTKCPACGAVLRPWVRFCTRCGHDVAGAGAVTPAEREELRTAVMSAVENDYEYLGEIRRSEGGGDVFFARERGTGRIAALRLNRSAADGEFELGETNILRKAPVPRPALVSVTQILRKLEPDTGTAPMLQSGGYPPLADVARQAVSANQQPDIDNRLPVEPDPGGGLPWSQRTILLAVGGVVAVITILALLVLR